MIERHYASYMQGDDSQLGLLRPDSSRPQASSSRCGPRD
jgi:hypothetical protein